MKPLLKTLSTALLLPLLLGTLLLGCSGSEAPLASEEDAAAEEITDAVEEAAEESEEADGEDSAEGDDEADSDGEEADDEADSDEDKKSDSDDVEQKNVKLEVSSQETAGQIVVKKVATARDGWVSVHKSKEDGTIVVPESIGEARVDSGDSEDIIVDLWEAPAIGDKLWVLLHVDSGERGVYEFPDKDAPVTKNGETMVRSFKIKGEAEKEEDEESEE